MNTASKVTAAVIAFATLGLADAGDLKANIGFPFSVRGEAQTAASYTIKPNRTYGGSMFYYLRNDETGQSVLLPTLIRSDSKDPDKRSRLVFRCLETCWISEMWTPDGAHYSASAPSIKVASGQTMKVATVYLDRRIGN